MGIYYTIAAVFLGMQLAAGENKLFPPIRIGIARDKAFNFYYPDNLDILANLGAELIFWSPLQGANLPENLQGLYFGGGFPDSGTE